MPEYTRDVTGMGTVRLLEAIREAGVDGALLPGVVVSEMFGAAPPPQSETTPFHPRSPYAVRQGRRRSGSRSTTARPTACSRPTASSSTTRARAAARRSSPARSRARSPASRPACRTSSTSATSTPSATGASRRDYADAMWRMLQHDEPEDFVIATGETHSVREFLDEPPFDAARPGLGERRRVRPALPPPRRGRRPAGRRRRRPSEKLGWEPTVDFEELVRMMVDADVKQLEDELSGRAVRM